MGKKSNKLTSSMKKAGSTIRRKAKLPDHHVALSLMMFGLLFAMPATIATIDYYSAVPMDNPIEVNEETILQSYQYDPGTGWATLWVAPADQNVVYPSENGGFYMFDTGIYTLLSIGWTLGNLNEKVGDSIQTVIIKTSFETNRVYLQFYNSGSENYPIVKYNFVQISPGVWEYQFSSAEILMLQRYANTSLYFTGMTAPADGIVEFSIEFYGSDIPFYYASLIAAVFGIVAIVVGLMALERFGFKRSVKK